MRRAPRRDAVLVSVVGVLLLSAITAGASVEEERAALLAEIAAEPIGLRAAPLVPPPAVKRTSASRRGGFELRTLFEAPIVFHRKVISPQDGQNCTFWPSCSTYGLQAIREYGPLGWAIASDRLLRCHPGNWHQYPHFRGLKRDPLPRREELRFDGSRAFFGGLLSIVPGLGQTIAGNWQDGLYALTTIGLWTFGTVYYAREERAVPAALTCSVAALFYVGNVFGGARAMGRKWAP